MQWTAGAKEPAHVVNTVDLGGIGKDASSVVHNQGVVIPTLPQLIAYLQKFVGALVALVVLLRFVRVLDGLVTIGKGDDVPTHPPTRQVVERGEEAGDIVGVLLADGKRGGQPNPGRRCSHPGEQRHRIMHRSLSSIPQGHVWCALVGIEDVVKIGEEDHVELTAFAHLGNVLIQFGPSPVIAAIGARMTPHGNTMVGRAMHQILRQVHVSGHRTPLYARSPITAG